MLPHLRGLFTSRIAQFLVLGAAFYGIDAARHHRSSSPREQQHVDLDPVALSELKSAQAKKLGVATLPEAGNREVEARAIEDEILYREALRLSLDKDDPIIRQRLIQKLLLLIEDMGGASREPNRAELRAFYDAKPDAWRKPTRWHFVHVFTRDRESMPSAEKLIAASSSGGGGGGGGDDGSTTPNLGEAFAYPRDMTLPRDAIERLFGESFSRAMVAIAPGEVSAPLQSPFGWHRVRVLERIEGARASFEDAEHEVMLDFLLDRRERVVGGYLTETAAAYDVRVGGAPVAHFVPTSRRVADRTEGSAED